MVFDMKHLLIALCCVCIVGADSWRFSIPRLTAVETREWSTDHLQGVMNLVAGNQNITSAYKIGDNIKKGVTVDTQGFAKDIALTGTESNLTIAFAIFNVGDKEPQETALQITSLILSIPKRVFALTIAAFTVDFILDFFKGAYRCEGPVAIAAILYTSKDLQAVKPNEVKCLKQVYRYGTGRGCVNVNPLSTKNSTYEVTYCFQRLNVASSSSRSTSITSTTSRTLTTSSTSIGSISSSIAAGASASNSRTTGTLAAAPTTATAPTTNSNPTAGPAIANAGHKTRWSKGGSIWSSITLILLALLDTIY